jgi:hypothetical protein
VTPLSTRRRSPGNYGLPRRCSCAVEVLREDSLRWCRCLVPQIEKPIRGEVVSQLEHLRVIAPEMLTHAAGQTSALLLQVVGGPTRTGRQRFVEIVDFGALIKEVRFAVDSPLEGAVTSEPVSGARPPQRSGDRPGQARGRGV